MKKILIFVLISVFVILLLNSCAKKEEKSFQGVNIANTASVNCVNNGGKLKIMEDEKGQHGVCVLSDGTECEEWAYYRKECPLEQNKYACYQQGTDCCKGYGENISCIDVNIKCAVGYGEKFLGCYLEKCTPKWDCVKIDNDKNNGLNEDYCEKDSDCACGVHVRTGECFSGNKEFVDASRQCPDFCAFMTPNGAVTVGDKCVNNKCA